MIKLPGEIRNVQQFLGKSWERLDEIIELELSRLGGNAIRNMQIRYGYTLLYAEYLAEDLLLDLPHRQFVFTIPKILRPYFKSDKRLFGEVSKLIFSLLSEFFSLAARQELLCACVVSYQPLKARVKPSRALSLWTNWLPICRREECNWFGDMGCTPGKFASSGNSVRVFTA